MLAFIIFRKGNKSIVMIREFQKEDVDEVVDIWLSTNIRAHSFIDEKYWIDNKELVRGMLLEAEIYVYEEERILGFIGLIDEYIAGIFVRDSFQSRGIGKNLLDHVKKLKSGLSLSVYKKNMDAIRFYKREGFIPGKENIDSNTHEPEISMCWRD